MISTLIVIILSVGILGLCFAGLAITIIVKENGTFPETEVGRNKNMQRLGIRCTKQEELNRWRNNTEPASESPCSPCSHCATQCDDRAQ
jgi:hypothetical protein